MLTNAKLLEEENQEDNKKTARLISLAVVILWDSYLWVAQGLKPLFGAMLRKDYRRFWNRLITR